MSEAPYKVTGHDNGCEVRQFEDGSIVKVPFADLALKPSAAEAEPDDKPKAKAKAKGADKPK